MENIETLYRRYANACFEGLDAFQTPDLASACFR